MSQARTSRIDDRHDTHETDAGLFGSGSVTWRVISDPAAGVGGIRALFLQALHPRAMAGVHEHSSFPEDFWPRLRRTADYVTTVAFGTSSEVDAAAARVRAVHRVIHGVDPVSGQRYSANDPDLLRWIHVCEVSSFLDAVRRGGLGISDAEADEFLAEQVGPAMLLGATDLPASRAEVEDYFRNVRPELTASPVSRRAALRLTLPPMPMRVALLTPARPAWTGIAALAFAMLPRWARRIYGLPGLPTTDLSATLALRGVRSTVLAIPKSMLPERRRNLTEHVPTSHAHQ